MAAPVAIEVFGSLLDEARSEGLRRSGEHRAASVKPRGPSPVLAFGTTSGLTGVSPEVRKRHGIAFPLSIVLHAAAVVAILLVPLLLGESLPQPSGGVRAFFVEPIAAPAPPPPPPPPAAARAAAARVAPKPVQAVAAGFVAPIEVPTEIKPEDGLDLGVEGGVPGGVEGGVPGGVVGGVVGGLPDAPPPPPVKAVRVGGHIREPRKIVDVAPVYPELAMKAGVQGIVIIEATIDPRGRVVDANVLKGIPMLDEAALEAVRKWAYTPTLLDGVPTPVIMTVTVRFRLKTANR